MLLSASDASEILCSTPDAGPIAGRSAGVGGGAGFSAAGDLSTAGDLSAAGDLSSGGGGATGAGGDVSGFTSAVDLGAG